MTIDAQMAKAHDVIEAIEAEELERLVLMEAELEDCETEEEAIACAGKWGFTLEFWTPEALH